MAGGGRGGDGGGDGQWRGGDGQQGGRVDFAPPSVRAIEANTSARAQADKSTLKVYLSCILTIVINRRHFRSTSRTEALMLSSLATPPISRSRIES